MSCFFQINVSLAIFSFNATRWTTEQFFTSRVTTCSEWSVAFFSYTIIHNGVGKAHIESFWANFHFFCYSTLFPRANQDVRLFCPWKKVQRARWNSAWPWDSKHQSSTEAFLFFNWFEHKQSLLNVKYWCTLFFGACIKSTRKVERLVGVLIMQNNDSASYLFFCTLTKCCSQETDIFMLLYSICKAVY